MAVGLGFFLSRKLTSLTSIGKAIQKTTSKLGGF